MPLLRRSTILAGLLMMAASTPAAWAAPPRPDLVVDPNVVASSWTVGTRYFAPGSCEIAHGCVAAPGWRNLLVFDVYTMNAGQTSLVLGDPNQSTLYEYDQCHGHHHLAGFSDYRLLAASGATVVEGHKLGWCLVDGHRFLDETWSPVDPVFMDCDYQGLSAGWFDEYTLGTPCQWIDVTETPPGAYSLDVLVNAGRIVPETSYANNSVRQDVVVDPVGGLPDLVMDGPFVSQTLQLETRTVIENGPDHREGCVAAPGRRRLLTFDTRLANVGRYDFVLDNPVNQVIINCANSHAHCHLEDYIEHTLVDPNGVVRSTSSQKLVEPSDIDPYLSESWVRPGRFYSNWMGHGLQRGWHQNVQERWCNVMDITDVPNGSYTLKVTVNPRGVIPESDLGNNTASIPVVVNNPVSSVSHRPDGVAIPGQLLEVASLEPGGALRLTYDVAACVPGNFNVYYSALPPGSYAYQGAACNIGISGSTVVGIPDPPAGALVWFVLVGREGLVEGGHGFDSGGTARPLQGRDSATGAYLCGMTSTLPGTICGGN